MDTPNETERARSPSNKNCVSRTETGRAVSHFRLPCSSGSVAQTSTQPRYSLWHPPPHAPLTSPPPPRRDADAATLTPLAHAAAAHASMSVAHLRTHCSASSTPLGAAAGTERHLATGTCMAATAIIPPPTLPAAICAREDENQRLRAPTDCQPPYSHPPIRAGSHASTGRGWVSFLTGKRKGKRQPSFLSSHSIPGWASGAHASYRTESPPRWHAFPTTTSSRDRSRSSSIRRLASSTAGRRGRQVGGAYRYVAVDDYEAGERCGDDAGPAGREIQGVPASRTGARETWSTCPPGATSAVGIFVHRIAASSSFPPASRKKAGNAKAKPSPPSSSSNPGPTCKQEHREERERKRRR
nr:unnamed protein product [Digitaria exilis]